MRFALAAALIAVLAAPATAQSALEQAGTEAEHEAAVAALAQRGRAAVPDLIQLLRHDDARVRQGAIDALGRIGPASVGPLKAELQAGRASREVLRALAGVGSVDSKTGYVMARLMLETRDPALQVEAARAVGRVSRDGWVGVEGAKALAKLLERSPLRRVRLAALAALEDVGPAAVGVLPRIRTLLLRSKDPALRRAAARALGATCSPAVVAVLVEALRDARAEVRVEAYRALGRLGAVAAGALETLIAALKLEPSDLRIEVLRTLRALGPAASPAAPAVEAVLRDPRQKELHGLADSTLQRIRPKAAPKAAQPPKREGDAALDQARYREAVRIVQLRRVADYPKATKLLRAIRRGSELYPDAQAYLQWMQADLKVRQAGRRFDQGEAKEALRLLAEAMQVEILGPDARASIRTRRTRWAKIHRSLQRGRERLAVGDLQAARLELERVLFLEPKAANAFNKRARELLKKVQKELDRRPR